MQAYDANDLVYARTRDFIVDEIIQNGGLSAAYGTFRAFDLPKLPRSRSNKFAPIALRLADYLDRGPTPFQRDRGCLLSTGCSGRSNR